MSNNKKGKYLKYAIGEIILVVIGILIALQVNNWNEYRKDRSDEKLVVKTLYNELQQNLEYSNAVRLQLEVRTNANNNLMAYTSAPESLSSPETFDSLLVRAFLFPPYTPIKADLERVLNSEQIHLIKVASFKDRLSDYKASLDEVALYYTYSEDDFKLLILPYFVDHYPLKSLLQQYGLGVVPTIHDRDFQNLLKSEKFENILAVIFADSGGLYESINKNIDILSQLIGLIEVEYQLSDGD